MIWNMDFKPVVEKLSLEQGDGNNYATHVSEIIDEVITSFIIQLSEVHESNKDEESLHTQASFAIDQWLKTMREEVNKLNQSVFWAKSLLVLLVKTLDYVKDWHPYIGIIDEQLKSKLPKHYKLNK
ncbi:hypothetical protein [Clostridium sp.]|uniref:hypothetical protein n=1 Tax=Clostridium sp. TaxID=1506 RepID=UPI002FCA8B82